MRTQQEYDAALLQLKRSPADVTDDQLAVFRDRNPGFADLVEEHRARHRRGAAYQERVAAAERDANYEADVRRRRFLNNLDQRARCYDGMGEPHPSRTPSRGVRLMSDAEIQRQKDRQAGIVRITPRGRQ